MKTLDDNGRPVRFDIEVISFDKKRGKGGRVLRFIGVQVSGLKQKSVKEKHIVRLQNTIIKRDPNHFENSTLNLYNPLKQSVHKIHVWLITRFNGEEVF